MWFNKAFISYYTNFSVYNGKTAELFYWPNAILCVHKVIDHLSDFKNEYGFFFFFWKESKCQNIKFIKLPNQTGNISLCKMLKQNLNVYLKFYINW